MTTTYPWARLIPREVHLRACGNCNKRTPTLGSRLRRVDGVRTWVCAACAKRMMGNTK